MRAVIPFTFMDYFLHKNNDDLPPLSSQISRSVELILRLTREIEYLEFKSFEVVAVVSIFVTRETNLEKSTKDHVSYEDERKTSKDGVESSENYVQVLGGLWLYASVTQCFWIPWCRQVDILQMKCLICIARDTGAAG
ncbi:hypothetical protein GIB67_023692 [Kingdonia uniflora]|uniref:Uncharacterized protein n=1 Tax=Kingdonia uniflora TaxID=39325 RepID=A0A7J7MG77_9MAGN|nr:hypothetical protein GIB67_023692 [Kingdonia uniflora]